MTAQRTGGGGLAGSYFYEVRAYIFLQCLATPDLDVTECAFPH